MRIDQLPDDVLQDILAECPERYRSGARTKAEMISAVKAALAHAVKESDVIEVSEVAA